MVKRTQVWYLMLADCEGNTHERYPEMPKIEFEIEAFNNESHFSEENKHEIVAGLIFLGIYFAMLGSSIFAML